MTGADDVGSLGRSENLLVVHQMRCERIAERHNTHFLLSKLQMPMSKTTVYITGWMGN